MAQQVFTDGESLASVQSKLNGNANDAEARFVAQAEEIAGKAAASHSHAISGVTGLQDALDAKQATLVSGTSVKTINGESLLGSGNLVISGSGGREFFPTIANGTDAEHDLDIGASRVWVSNGSLELLVDLTAATIAIDGAGLDTGTVANNTFYYTWVFHNPTTNDSIYRLSASATSPTLPSGYTYQRRLPGAILTDSSGNIRGFLQVSRNKFLFQSQIEEFYITSGFSTDPANLTVSAPPNSQVVIGVQLGGSVTHRADIYPTAMATPNLLPELHAYSGNEVGGSAVGDVLVDSSRQVKRRITNTSGLTLIYVYTIGFITDW